MINAVLFDLDGTLLDTAPDLHFALNKLRGEHGMSELPFSTIRSMISLGSKQLVKAGLGLEEDHPQFLSLRQRFFDLYQTYIANSTQFFPQIEQVLKFLTDHGIAWGIVTNKLTRHTTELLKAIPFTIKPQCIICGDTLKTAKPDPEPILFACQLLDRQPNQCLYVGDSLTDVRASKAAGTKTLVALYGYIGEDEDPKTWLADGYIQQPGDIIEWILQYQTNE